MKILLLIKWHDIERFNGLFDFLTGLINSVKRKGYGAELVILNGTKPPLTALDTFIISLGEECGDLSFAVLPLSGDFAQISQDFFECVKTILFQQGEQLTAKLFGGENLDARIAEIENKYGDVKIFYYKSGLVTTLKIIFKGENHIAVSDVFYTFGKNIYAEEDVTLSKRLLQLLSVRGKKLAVAESLTGGGVCSMLIDNAGASENFFEGIVCYDNKSKINRLNVDPDIIREYGAVSYETAYEMAAGLITQGSCDVSIATTGIAGPDGATLSKPLGLTYIAIGTREKVHVFRHVFSGDRNYVRQAACSAALFYAIKVLKDNSLEYEEIKIN